MSSISLTLKNPDEVELIDIISKALKNPSIQLTKEEITYINNLLDNNPELFNTIQNSVKNIIKDGEINLNDIPDFILLVVNLFNSDIQNIEDINLTNIIKFILDVIINSGLIPFNKEKIDIIIKIVDVSLKLLNTTILTPENKKKCYDSINKCFSSCFSFCCSSSCCKTNSNKTNSNKTNNNKI